MPHFFLQTLGCKVNQYESRALAEAWIRLGACEAARPSEADCILINSCAVTAKAVADVRRAVRRLHAEAPSARLAVLGCAAGLLRASDLPDQILLLDNGWKADPTGLLARLADPTANPAAAQTAEGAALEAGRSAFPPLSLSSYHRARAVLKIQDGCSHACAYCIVPSVRGPSRSRPLDDTLAEARRLAEAGFPEIGINGINLRQYGRDLPESPDFWDLLLALDRALAPEWTDRLRLRLSSLEPGQLGDKALETLSRCRLAAPHLHLSLQSGSASVLRRMGRGHYNPADLPDFLRSLHGISPLWGLGADLIAGFPGETPEEHAETLALCRALPLTYAHVFPFSSRPGTRAAALPFALPDDEKKARAAALRTLAAAKKEAFLRRQLELPFVVPVPENAEGSRKGVNEYYTECRFLGSVPAEGLFRARPVGLEKDTLLVQAEARQ